MNPVYVFIVILTIGSALAQPAIPIETPLVVDLIRSDATEAPILNRKSRSWDEFEIELTRLQNAFGDKDPVIILISQETPFVAVMRASRTVRKYYSRVFVSLVKSDRTTIAINVWIEPVDERDLPRWMNLPPLNPILIK